VWSGFSKWAAPCVGRAGIIGAYRLLSIYMGSFLIWPCFFFDMSVRTKITIIEDDDDLRSLIRVPLQAAGYDVVALSEGNDLVGNSDSVPHLYIIDLNLGGMSGLEICKGIKSQKHREIVPVVIIMSANPDVRQLALEACADDALLKPFSAKELLKKISDFFPEALVA
jgi:DNA-binding response OmpR family regulator